MMLGLRLTLAAGVATLLGVVPVGGAFEDWSWLKPVIVAVLVVMAVGLACRALRVHPAAIAPVQAVVLLLAGTAYWEPGSAWLSVIPTRASFAGFGALLSSGMSDVRYLASPVPTTGGIVALTVVAIAATAIVVDLLTASVGRPAVGGLALLAVFAVASAVSRGVGWPEFAAAGLGYLLLLGVQCRDRLLRWSTVGAVGRGSSGTSDSSATAAGTGASSGGAAAPRASSRYVSAGRVGVAALAVALLIPAITPGFTRNVLGTIGQTNGAGVGDNGSSTGRSISPFTTLTHSLRDSRIDDLFSVSPTVADPYYLRTVVLDAYGKNGWSQSSHERADQIPLGSATTVPVPGKLRTLQSTGKARSYSASVVIADYRDRNLPVYYAPETVSGRRQLDGLYNPLDSTISTGGRTTQRGESYRMTVVEPRPSYQQLAATTAVAASDPVMTRYGSKPAVSATVRKDTATAAGGAATPFGKAEGIYHYFSDGTQGFQYSLTVRSGPTNDPLQNFLVNKQGYCEQYATAMAVMLRLEGIPSRVVLGYTAGTANSDGSTWTVTNHDAHAWVEAYFAGVGWTEFDPTPLGDGRGQEEPYLQPNASTGPITGPQPTAPTQAHNAPRPQPTAPEPTQQAVGGGGARGGSGGGPGVPGWIGLALLAAVLATAVPASVRSLLRRRRRRTSAGNDPVLAAHAAWTELLAVARDYRIGVRASGSPRTVAAELSKAAADRSGQRAIAALALAEERARYSAHPQSDPDLSVQLQTAVQALRAGLGSGERFRYGMFPRSLRRRTETAPPPGSSLAHPV